MSNRYTKLAADGSGLAIEATGHLAVRIDNALLAAPIIVTAHRSPERMTQQDAEKWAAGLTINGWSWRLPTIDEANFIPDRTKYPAYDKNFFPDCEGEWLRASTPAAYSPSGCAWVVSFGSGDSGWDSQDDEYFARAVRSSQS